MKLEEQVAKFKRYKWIFDVITSYWIMSLLLLFFIADNFIIMPFFDRQPFGWEAYVLAVMVFALWAYLLNETKKRVKKYRVKDDEWATFYTNSIMRNLEKYSKTDNSEMKKDYRKNAVKNAEEFLSCIEKRWKIGRFKLARNYFGKSLSELKKNMRYRVIPFLKDGDDQLLSQIEQIMRNFHGESRRFSLEGINKINEQMSSRLPTTEKLKVGFRHGLSIFLNTHKILRHGLFVTSLLVGCFALYYLLIEQVEIQKEYAVTVSVAAFLALLEIYFRRQPKE